MGIRGWVLNRGEELPLNALVRFRGRVWRVVQARTGSAVLEPVKGAKSGRLEVARRAEVEWRPGKPAGGKQHTPTP